MIEEALVAERIAVDYAEHAEDLRTLIEALGRDERQASRG